MNNVTECDVKAAVFQTSSAYDTGIIEIRLNGEKVGDLIWGQRSAVNLYTPSAAEHIRLRRIELRFIIGGENEKNHIGITSVMRFVRAFRL